MQWTSSEVIFRWLRWPAFYVFPSIGMDLGCSDSIKTNRKSFSPCYQDGGTLEVQLLAFSSSLCSLSRRGMRPDSCNIHLPIGKERMQRIDIRREDAGVTGCYWWWGRAGSYERNQRWALSSKFQHQSHLWKYFITINSPDFWQPRHPPKWSLPVFGSLLGTPLLCQVLCFQSLERIKASKTQALSLSSL